MKTTINVMLSINKFDFGGNDVPWILKAFFTSARRRATIYKETVKLYFPEPNSFCSLELGRITVADVFTGISIS